MAAFCLPKSESSKFLAALKNGTLDPAKLQEMSSKDRRAEFAKVLGDDTAKEVNALFEDKVLYQAQKNGLLNWAKQVAGISEDTRKTLVDKINGMKGILDPDGKFLEDLARTKLGATVTTEEAKAIFDLSQKAKAAKEALNGTEDVRVDRPDVSNPVYQARVEYGNAIQDLKDKLEELKPQGQTFTQHLLNVLTFPKTVATGILHFSALGVQGWGLISHKVTWEAAWQQFGYFFNKDKYRDLEAYIISHPDYKYALDGRLGLTSISDKLSLREEALQSSILQHMSKYVSDKTGAFDIIAGSSRAFTGFLNYQRFNRFVDLLNAARSAGEDVSVGSPVVKQLASVVNNFTGRGELGPGDTWAAHQAALNTVFFAPRKLSATIQMFNPVYYMKLQGTARNAAIRQLSGSLLATGTLLYLANQMGAKIDYNPVSQNFLKIQIGPEGNEEKLDVTGGNAIYIRFLARMLLNKEISAKGKETELGEGYRPITRADLAVEFVRGKLSPSVGAFADFMYGKDQAGRPFNIPQELRDRFDPIVVTSWMDYWRQNPENSAAMIPSLSALFGVQLESPLAPPYTQGLTPWGDPVGSFSDPVRNNLDKEMASIGMAAFPPTNTINGVKLTDSQYHEYIGLSGSQAKARLNSLFNSEFYAGLSTPQKQKVVQGVINSSRKIAQDRIKADSLGSDNDIIKKSLEAKRLKLQGQQ